MGRTRDRVLINPWLRPTASDGISKRSFTLQLCRPNISYQHSSILLNLQNTVGKYAIFFDAQMLKSFQFQMGRLRPSRLRPPQELCPLNHRWGLCQCPQTPL